MIKTEQLFKILREVKTRLFGFPENRSIDYSNVDLFDEEANDAIFVHVNDAIGKGNGYAACKFGTIELGNILSAVKENKWAISDYLKLINGYPIPIYRYKELERLGNNAGFFPADKASVDKFVELMLSDIKEVDILASYVYTERYINDLLTNCLKVNLDGFYAPFLFPNPWTKVLKNKRVLVIHPFAESIQSQYSKRELLFENQDVLPEFKSLRVIKAVQSIAGNPCGFDTWFEALDYMKREMEKEDFDIALIGCGAYGFPLTVHAKRMGKVGIHLAGWLQMLFGIYGKRWVEDQPQYAKFIN